MRKLQALATGDGLPAWLEGRQILDLLEDFPHGLTAEQLTSILRKLPPRLFSIASSPAGRTGEAHLPSPPFVMRPTAGSGKGVCSTWLADR